MFNKSMFSCGVVELETNFKPSKAQSIVNQSKVMRNSGDTFGISVFEETNGNIILFNPAFSLVSVINYGINNTSSYC